MRKKPIWPALLSALVAPGVGQIANKDYAKGFFLLVSSLGSFFWFSKVITERLSMILPGSPEQWATDQTVLRNALMKLATENNDMFTTFQVLMLVIWSFGIIDAYITARRNLNRVEPPSDEDTNSVD